MTLAVVSSRRKVWSRAQTSIFTVENEYNILWVQMAPQASWPSSTPLGLQNHCLGSRAGDIYIYIYIYKNASQEVTGSSLQAHHTDPDTYRNTDQPDATKSAQIMLAPLDETRCPKSTLAVVDICIQECTSFREPGQHPQTASFP